MRYLKKIMHLPNHFLHEIALIKRQNKLGAEE